VKIFLPLPEGLPEWQSSFAWTAALNSWARPLDDSTALDQECLTIGHHKPRRVVKLKGANANKGIQKARLMIPSQPETRTVCGAQ
jgi:hypothetical protein